MTLEEYLEELTDTNWHTLRQLIELERGTIEARSYHETMTAYETAKAWLLWARDNRQRKANIRAGVDL